MSDFAGFPTDTRQFLRELKANNNKAWFTANKNRYERAVKAPALACIAALAVPFATLAPQFRVIPRVQGGSLMRIYRDLRFHQGEPYKTNIGMQFRHSLHGENVHCPGFYLHIDPDECFLGAGLWRPQPTDLRKIRTFLADNPGAWQHIVNDEGFAKTFCFGGDSLQRPPRDFDANHPLIDDIKRKDFFVTHAFRGELCEEPAIIDYIADHCRQVREFMRYLCAALDLPY